MIDSPSKISVGMVTTSMRVRRGVAIAQLSRCKRCDSLPSFGAVSQGATTVGNNATHQLKPWLSSMFSLSLTSTAVKSRLDAQDTKPWFGGGSWMA